MNKDIFLSHAWGYDSENRDNHKRVKELASKLQNYGYFVWIDENDLQGNIDNGICDGINKSKVVILCLTENYINKINKAKGLNDNCLKEFNYTMHLNKLIIPIIMDSKSSQMYLRQSGIVQLYLNSILYLDFSINFHENWYSLIRLLNNYNIKKYNINKTSSFGKLITVINNKNTLKNNNNLRKIIKYRLSYYKTDKKDKTDKTDKTDKKGNKIVKRIYI